MIRVGLSQEELYPCFVAREVKSEVKPDLDDGYYSDVFVEVPEEVFARWEAAKNAHYKVMDEISKLYFVEMEKLRESEEESEEDA